MNVPRVEVKNNFTPSYFKVQENNTLLQTRKKKTHTFLEVLRK